MKFDGRDEKWKANKIIVTYFESVGYKLDFGSSIYVQYCWKFLTGNEIMRFEDHSVKVVSRGYLMSENVRTLNWIIKDLENKKMKILILKKFKSFIQWKKKIRKWRNCSTFMRWLDNFTNWGHHFVKTENYFIDTKE